MGSIGNEGMGYGDYSKGENDHSALTSTVGKVGFLSIRLSQNCDATSGDFSTQNLG